MVCKRVREWAYGLPMPPIVRMLGELVWRTAHNFSRNEGAHMAAGMAYYTIFSLFPLALGAIALTGFFASSEEAQLRLFEFLDGQVPGLGGSTALRENIQGLVQARGALSTVSVLMLFVAGRVIFGALHRILNKAWRVSEPRHFLVQQVRELGMALGVGMVLLGSVFLSTFGQVVAQGPGLLRIRVELIQWAWASLFALVPFFLSTAMFVLVYRFVPNAKVHWRHVVPAALLTGALFEASKVSFVIYLDKFAAFDRVYGSISAIVVLMLWAYVASLILVAGAEVASELARSEEEGRVRWRGSLRPVKGGLRPTDEYLPVD